MKERSLGFKTGECKIGLNNISKKPTQLPSTNMVIFKSSNTGEHSKEFLTGLARLETVLIVASLGKACYIDRLPYSKFQSSLLLLGDKGNKGII